MSGVGKDAALVNALTKYAGVTLTEVARSAKVDPETLRKPSKGITDNRLSQRTIEKLRNAFPTYPGWAEYLGQSGGALSDRQLPYRHQGSDNSDTVELDQIDLRYGLGGTYAEGHVEVERRPFSREWLRSITSTAPRHLFWAIGDGDSMEPTIRSGEVILIDRSLDTPRFDDGVWAVVHGEIGMIKRLRHLPDGTVELHSDNHYVRPQTAVDGELHIVGRVIAVVRRI